MKPETVASVGPFVLKRTHISFIHPVYTVSAGVRLDSLGANSFSSGHGEVSSSSGCFERGTLFYCGTP